VLLVQHDQTEGARGKPRMAERVRHQQRGRLLRCFPAAPPDNDPLSNR